MVFTIPVLEEHGLEICWNNNITAGELKNCSDKDGNLFPAANGNQYCFDCETYDIPTWLDGFVTFLWVLFAIGKCFEDDFCKNHNNVFDYFLKYFLETLVF